MAGLRHTINKRLQHGKVFVFVQIFQRIIKQYSKAPVYCNNINIYRNYSIIFSAASDYVSFS